ncbi:hypothetical protein [Paenibacillus terrae]|uniref:Uncharacterized protein n=1 Tax=Paenibacillus terrae TaxID=159743 RepID=A0A0D7WYS6_9BACL|nr:hypothetical protein [Paenibacillus terrae]KJD43868.1 hypothetical protein QD47_20285 [Paenibacillus terrae]
MKREELVNTNKEFHVYYCGPDEKYALRLNAFKEVILHEYDYNNHNIAKYLRDQGELQKIFNQFLQAQSRN